MTDSAAQIFAVFKLFRFSILSYSLSYSTTIFLMTIRMTWHFKTNSSPCILHTIKNWNNFKIFYWPKWRNKRNSASSSEGTYIHIMNLYASVILTLFWYLLLFFQKFLCLGCGHFVGRNSALSLVWSWIQTSSPKVRRRPKLWSIRVVTVLSTSKIN